MLPILLHIIDFYLFYSFENSSYQLAAGFSLESEWLLVSSSFQDSS